MLALARVCAIIHLSICMPTRWLAGNSHKLEKYDWSVRSMGKIVDILEESLEELKEDGSKIMNEKFMMGFFDDIKNTIPHLRIITGICTSIKESNLYHQEIQRSFL